MITVATLLWDANANSRYFSRCYDESWVEKLYRGFARNLSAPFRFVCYTDRPRTFSEPVSQIQMAAREPGYSACIEPYGLGVPMILVGLDTVVTGNCDALAEYCFTEKTLALPRDPYNPKIACNGVALVPAGYREIAVKHRGENDMEWVREFPHVFLDGVFPGAVDSFKGQVRDHGLADQRIVYFHGPEKAHQLPGVPWIARHWR